MEMLLQTDIEHDIEQDTDIFTEESESLEPPWRVFVHNDDVTPYDFVLVILQRIFELNPLVAEHVTYVAHTSGIAYVTTLPKSEAEKRVGKAHFAASLEGYPLTFTIEPE
jgi:ATP-dependent Clp protease adaptor protein ClpS